MPHCFFYGTLMAGFDNRRTAGLEPELTPLGRGWIAARLYDLGDYPGAVPDSQARVQGELYALRDEATVLARLDAIEGCDPADATHSLYVRRLTPVHLGDDSVVDAWVYFYNRPLGDAVRIEPGDYRAWDGRR